MKITRLNFLLLLSALTFFAQTQAKITLPHLISEGMILQRDQEINIWGWADEGETVTINFDGEELSATTEKNGKWQFRFDAKPAGGPYRITISGRENQFEFSDVWMGDVWVCSGQSNMETTMARVSPMFPEEFKQPNLPLVRQFDVPDAYDFSTQNEDTKGGHWVKVDSANIKDFSAVAYFFARALHDKYEIPVGVIVAAVGGSPIQSWIRENELKQFPEDYSEALKFQNENVIKEIEDGDNARISKWHREAYHMDLGSRKNATSWSSTSFSPDSSWQQMKDLGFLPDSASNGIYWFRKEFILDDTKASDFTGQLLMGTIVDSDSIYINGSKVGHTTYRYPPRRYDIPKGILKNGKNVITVRVISERGPGGFTPGKEHALHLNNGEVVDLQNNWRYKQGAKMPVLVGQTAIRFKPLGLYNAMIAPLHGFAVKGVLWYQGESNTGAAEIYLNQLKALTTGWRSEWNREDLPFLFVQLPNFMAPDETPQESGWATLREQQRLASAEIPYTGLAVTIDVGEANDIHPLDKKTVGNRLALQAEKLVYGEEKVVASGPVVKSATGKGSKIEIEFEKSGSSLFVNTGNNLEEFAIAGADGKYYRAKAKIEGNHVIVWSENVPEPTSVRYAWANNPSKANLYNEAGLPASPFQIDVNQ